MKTMTSRFKSFGLCATFGALVGVTLPAMAEVNLDMPKSKPFTDFNNVDLERAIYKPLASYRVGPYAAGGTGYYGGLIDVFKWVNLKYGGVNGVPIVWEECETEWDTPRGVECYERYKSKGKYGPTANDPLSVGIAYALQEKTTADKIPSITPNHGNTASQDGRIFPYQFPLEITPYDEVSILINYAGQQLGGMDKLSGKKIAVTYHGSAYGRETIGFLETLAKKHGFELQQIEVAHPGNEQTAIWQKIKRWNPDFTIVRGWGVQVPVAIKTAAKVGYPVEKILGNIWSNSEADVIPAGDAAKGYIAINTQAPGRDWPLIKELWETLYAPGSLCGGKKCGDMLDDTKVGSVYYNLGVVAGIFHLESMRIAMNKFGNDMPLDGEHSRWGLENMNFTDEKLAEWGVLGMMQNVKTSCKDHTGGHMAKFAQWDGSKFTLITKDWIQSELDLIWSLIYERSEQYAKEQGVHIRNCDDGKDRMWIGTKGDKFGTAPYTD